MPMTTLVALSLNPDSATLNNRRGWAYLLSDAFKLALVDFDAALKLDPGLGHAYSGRGLARVSLGQWRDAVADVDTAVNLATRPAPGSNNRFDATPRGSTPWPPATPVKMRAATVSRVSGEHRRLRERASKRYCSIRSISFRPTSRPGSAATMWLTFGPGVAAVSGRK